jgi:hypothetical protein
MIRAFVSNGSASTDGAEEPEGPVLQAVQIRAADGSPTIGSVSELPSSE